MQYVVHHRSDPDWIIAYLDTPTRLYDRELEVWLKEMGYRFQSWPRSIKRPKGDSETQHIMAVSLLEHYAVEAPPRWRRISEMRDDVTRDIGRNTIEPRLILDTRKKPEKAERLLSPKIVINNPVGSYDPGLISLFTFTSKMNCPSFSLPAGPCDLGGTCAPSREGDIDPYEVAKFHQDIAERDPGSFFICDECYAGRGMYDGMFNVAANQIITLEWSELTLDMGIFVEEMVSAIDYIGLPQFRAWGKSNMVDPRFFRIHDSGEFYSERYYAAWVDICNQLPDVHFWAPTRLWVYPEWREIFMDYPAPENLSLRPSALAVGMLPPRGFDPRMNLAAGSMSTPGFPPEDVWNCPASSKEDPGWKEGACLDNSSGRKCRRCWVAPDLEVSYWTH
jgi:hypothetical protein